MNNYNINNFYQLDNTNLILHTKELHNNNNLMKKLKLHMKKIINNLYCNNYHNINNNY